MKLDVRCVVRKVRICIDEQTDDNYIVNQQR